MQHDVFELHLEERFFHGLVNAALMDTACALTPPCGLDRIRSSEFKVSRRLDRVGQVLVAPALDEALDHVHRALGLVAGHDVARRAHHHLREVAHLKKRRGRHEQQIATFGHMGSPGPGLTWRA